MKKRGFFRMCFLVVLTVACMGFMTAQAEAGLLDYSFSATEVYGVFGDTEFNNGAFKIDFFGDPVLVDFTDPGVPFNPSLPGTIWLSAPEIGSIFGFFADLQDVFIDQTYEIVGFGTAATDLLDVFAPGQGLTTYDLTTSFGPITGSLLFASDMDLIVDGAPVVFGLEDAGPITFQAVPEPGTMMLLGLGLIGLFGFRRKFMN